MRFRFSDTAASFNFIEDIGWKCCYIPIFKNYMCFSKLNYTLDLEGLGEDYFQLWLSSNNKEIIYIKENINLTEKKLLQILDDVIPKN